MSDTMVTNGYLQALSDQLEILMEAPGVLLEKFAASHGVPLNTDKWSTTIIDWSKIDHTTTDFDFDGSEIVISQKLSESQLQKSSHLIVELGYDEPVRLVETSVFIAHWYSFFAASGFMNVVAFSPEAPNLIEFSDRDFLLRCNFK